MKGFYFSLFASFFFLIGCDKADELVEDCGCIKTSYSTGFSTASSGSRFKIVTGTENVPCQPNRSQVTTQVGKGGNPDRYYVITCLTYR